MYREKDLLGVELEMGFRVEFVSSRNRVKLKCCYLLITCDTNNGNINLDFGN